MEIIGFIKKLRKKNIVYYDVWMPIILQFDSSLIEKKIKISLYVKFQKNTYYRAIDYGMEIFSDFVKDYVLEKQKGFLIIKKIQLEQPTKPKKVKPKTNDKIQDELENVYDEIISYLNYATGREFRATTKSYQTLIKSRISEGFQIDDFKKVIDIKAKKWLNTNQEDYLRPETLFSTKFQGYLNENLIAPKTNLTKAYEQVDNASKLRDSQG
jgi:uncharacterized phage protein (TIGR02220 family)